MGTYSYYEALENAAYQDAQLTYDPHAGGYFRIPTDIYAPTVEEINLLELWAEVGSSAAHFYDALGLLTGTRDGVAICENCGDPQLTDNMTGTGRYDDYMVCTENCLDEYRQCDCCEHYFTNEVMASTLDDEIICERCQSNSYSYCDECDGWYADTNEWQHNHADFDDDNDECDDEDSCCDAPFKQFAIRNDGNAPLLNDTRVTVTLPGGVISPAGLSAIASYLESMAWNSDTWAATISATVAGNKESSWHGQYMSDRDRAQYLSSHVRHAATPNFAEKIGNKWQAKNGNFTKRVSRYAHNEFGLKIPPAIISGIGNLAAAHSRSVDVHLELTRELNMPALEFWHGGSCWWGGYSRSRCTLKTNGGFGMRTFASAAQDAQGAASAGTGGRGTHGDIMGRAWVLPVMIETRDVTEKYRPEMAGCCTYENGYCHDSFDWYYVNGQRVYLNARMMHLARYERARREFVAQGQRIETVVTPTHDTENPDGYIVFNGYGDLADYAPARILAQMVGMTYTKIGFSCEPMYINAGGYLVSSEEHVSRFTDSGIYLDVAIHADIPEMPASPLMSSLTTVNA